MKGLVTNNTHVQYMHESPVSSGKKVMAKVKKFVHVNTDYNTDKDTRAMA